MGKNILAIDDDENMLDFYKAALSEFGDIRTATNLQEARKHLAGLDLIVLDFHLEKDPEKFQDIVPELKRTAPILLCSGVQTPEVEGLGIALGVAGYWNKGTDHEKLRSLVKSTLSSGKSVS